MSEADKRPAILIVEDEPIIAWSLAEMVQELGYAVCATVATENAAVENAPGCDAVLMDVRLADGGSGVAAARQIRASETMPIVFCTAFSHDPRFAHEMRAIARSTVIAKPVSAHNLKAAFARLFGEDSDG